MASISLFFVCSSFSSPLASNIIYYLQLHHVELLLLEKWYHRTLDIRVLFYLFIFLFVCFKLQRRLNYSFIAFSRSSIFLTRLFTINTFDSRTKNNLITGYVSICIIRTDKIDRLTRLFPTLLLHSNYYGELRGTEKESNSAIR